MDAVVCAIGNSPNPLVPSTTPGLDTTRRGTLVADQETGKTTKDRVWAGGDIVTGAATVILAMGAGRRAARRGASRARAGRSDGRFGRAARLGAAAEDLAKLFRQQVHELDRLRVDRAPKENLADAGEAFRLTAQVSGGAGENPEEIHAFADGFCIQGKPPAKVTGRGKSSGASAAGSTIGRWPARRASRRGASCARSR